MNNDEKITYFGETDSRNKRMPFGIKNKDRSRHMYVIGKTGMGKSTLLENMAVQDIQNGEGLAFIDPHGKTADLLLEYVPQNRIKDVVYFAPFDTEFPISFNVMEDVGPNKRHLVANGLMSAFKKIWVDAWSARMEYILNNILLALLEYPDSTLIGVNRMLADKDYRKLVVDNISDPSVKSFWVDEFAKYGEKYMQEAGAAIQNKIGQFVSNPLVRNIIGQPKSSFDIRKVMDEKKIMIINLSKGRVGEANANLLGSMVITKIFLAALSRADVTESKLKTLPPFYLFVDEFQNFANESFADILSEARKYKLSLTVAHQYIEQMSEEVRAAVFGNVGTMITFRVGAYDAEVLEKEFAPTFTAEDLVNLGFVQTYLKLMIDGVSSPPFSAATLPPIKKPDISFRDDIIEKSREQFANPRSEVDETIRKWHAPVVRPAPRPITPEEKKLPPKPPVSAGGTAPTAPVSATAAPSQPVASRPAPVSAPVPAPVSRVAHVDHKPAAVVRPASTPTPKPAPHVQKPPERPAQHTQPIKPAGSAGPVTPTRPPITLDSLRKDKGPGGKNLSDLKEALKTIVEKSHHEKKVESLVKPAAATPATASTPKPPPTPSPSLKKEVPEDLLRKVLGTTENATEK